MNRINFTITSIICIYFSIKIQDLLYICGDIELNPGDYFTFMHWNCNSLPAHDFSRVSLIESYNSLHNFNLIALSETALKKNVDNKVIELPGYSIIRNDLPDDGVTHHGGVMIYYKSDLAVKHRLDIQNHSNTIVLQLNISRKKIFFILAYRKFNQTSHEFEIFEEKLNEVLDKARGENPTSIILVGDLNAHLKEWYSGDTNDNYGLAIQRIFNKHGLSQLVEQPTYITNNSQTCIDILATDQPNLVLKNDVHPSLHSNCHHQINYAQLNFSCPPPPPHTRHIWHYSRADPDLLIKSANEYNWEENLNGLDPPLQVKHFTEVILNIAKKFIPNEIKTFNPKDPPWLTKSCKALYSKYKRQYKKCEKKNFPPEEKEKVDKLKNEYSVMVVDAKEKYLSSLGKSLSDPQTCKKKNTGQL